ncbi:hypothetical protein GWG67_10330 [Bradyrhizobium sp. CSS354]|nr:hypothetical protein [Bradyrhizobium sp. CSS354]
MRRSNPDCFRGKILDCFAALAMTRLWRHLAHSQQFARSSQSARRRGPSLHRHCEELLRRSNPDCLHGNTLDCFATLAMTRCVVTPGAIRSASRTNPSNRD